MRNEECHEGQIVILKNLFPVSTHSDSQTSNLPRGPEDKWDSSQICNPKRLSMKMWIYPINSYSDVTNRAVQPLYPFSQPRRSPGCSSGLTGVLLPSLWKVQQLPGSANALLCPGCDCLIMLLAVPFLSTALTNTFILFFICILISDPVGPKEVKSYSSSCFLLAN